MILFINGAFGVGKTTVGKLLWERIAGSRLYNPELTGSVLMRLPGIFEGAGTDDFQDISLWRRSVVQGIRVFRAISQTVIVPMAFYNRDYFDEIVRGVGEFDKDVRVFCLKADIDTIKKRLERRGGEIDWSLQKARDCIEAH